MSEEPRELTDAELEELVERSRVRGYLMHFDLPDPTPDVPGQPTAPMGRTPGCWLGGLPTLPSKISWPRYKSKIYKVDVPMFFLGQVDCTQLPPINERPEIPSEGTLFFFYDPIFDSEHKGSGKVIYVTDDVSTTPERIAPEFPEIDYQCIERSDYLIVPYDPITTLPKWTFSLIIYDDWPIDKFFNDPQFIQITSHIRNLKKIQEQNLIEKSNQKIEKIFEVSTLFGIPTQLSEERKHEITPTSCCIAAFRSARIHANLAGPGADCLNFFLEWEDLLNRNFIKS